MTTTSPQRTKTTARDGLSSDAPPPADTKQPAGGSRLHRVIWRWHFYAGVIVAPVLIVVAATGALYIFKDELEAVLHPGVTYVEPAAERVSYAQQLAAARASVPKPVTIGLMQVFADPKRATAIAMASDKFQMGYVDPYRGRFLGAIDAGGFFDIVLRLHRTLFVGTTGRIAIELTTCWAVVLVATGMYLWWPRQWNQVWGVWLPRLRRKPYVVLRDLHSVAGIYVGIIAGVIALTGLIYTYAWGGGFQYAAQKTGAYDMFSKPMLSKCPPDAKDLPIDRFVEIGHEKMPGKSLNVWFPRAPNAVYMVFGSSDYGPSVHRMLFIDRATGEILADRSVNEANPLYAFGAWNYPLHAGTILGMTSKILWLLTCLVLMTLPVTGLWMWWERRPTGSLGVPRRVQTRRPRWLVATIATTSVLLPMLGLSVVVVLVLDLIVLRARRVWA